MVYGCSAKVIKWLVCFFNFIAFVSGIAVFAASLVTYLDNDVRTFLLNKIDNDGSGLDLGSLKSIETLLIVGMVLGGVIFICGFLGCCGAMCESKCLLTLFSIVMMLLLVIQFVIAIVVFAFKGTAKDSLNSVLKEIKKDANKGDAAACDLFIDMDTNLHCCGYDGMSLGNCGANNTCHTASINHTCGDVLWRDLENNMNIAGTVLFILIILEVLATAFGFCLCCAIRRGETLYETV